MLALVRTLAVSVLALPCAAGTWVVDDDGGPGVDFTDLPPAIAAAADGDTLLVLPGDYSAFVLGKPLALVAPGGATVAGLICRFFELPAGSTTTVSGFTFATESSVSIIDCFGTLVLDQVTVLDAGMFIHRASDVRMRASRVEDGLFIHPDSRVEASECTLLRGTWQAECPGDGEYAVYAAVAARAHLYRSWIVGGKGPSANPLVCYGGNGGDGIQTSTAKLLLAGDPEHFVKGGEGGSGMQSGLPGDGILLGYQTHARISGVTVSTFHPNSAASAILEVPVPRDPTLFIFDQVAAGEPLLLRVQAEPGATVELLLGRKPALGAQVGSAEVLLILPLRTFQLGTAPANGVAGLNFLTPAHLTPGFTYFAQGRVTFPGGEERYTNSVPIVVQ